MKSFDTVATPCFANTCEESCELFKRKPNKQYHTENQGLRIRTIFLPIDRFKTRRERLKSALYLRLKKRKVLRKCSGLLLEYNQFYSLKKTVRSDRHKTRKLLFSPTGKNKKFFSFEKKSRHRKTKRTPIKFAKRIFQAKNFVKREGVPFYRKRTVSKKKVAQCRNKAVRLISPTGLKMKSKVTYRTGETNLLNRKPLRKKTKN